MEKKTSSWLLATLLCFAALGVISGADNSLAGKCSSVLQKVTPCLAFATAKEAAPSKDCCDSVTDLKDTDPACLCFIIQQIHNGSSEAIKSLGVQESRLLQLQSACRVANASISECPRLLHLAPNSPDAAIFTNASTTATNSTPISTPSTSSPGSDSHGFTHKPRLAGFIVVVVSVFFHTFPVELLPC
ncbi:hypothetical protein CDL12_16088 [Handroanthus impetiginosus]|uniref:Bifunctional inhibitor/plant lipid transfer protein/seed storage helical domain-containing protein n=1 Tax=Handroanthus impetiginosus TaxID=429701 RepID=A0A2G9H1B2_9LAMI|nr:hypothetical protein CDL12_16088 [Handroanthus impetiginosus]